MFKRNENIQRKVELIAKNSQIYIYYPRISCNLNVILVNALLFCSQILPFRIILNEFQMSLFRLNEFPSKSSEVLMKS